MGGTLGKKYRFSLRKSSGEKNEFYVFENPEQFSGNHFSKTDEQINQDIAQIKDQIKKKRDRCLTDKQNLISGGDKIHYV